MSKTILERIRSWLLFFYALSILWQLIAVFIIDERWWFFLFEVVALTVFLLYLYREEIWNTSPLKENIKFTSFCAMIGSSVFVLITSIIVTPWWLFGLSIPILLFILWNSLKTDKKVKVDGNSRQLTIITISSVFVLNLFIYSVPTYITNSDLANNPSTPANSYNSDPMKVYCLYGCELDTANREHVIALSWFNQNNRANDNHNMIWANAIINYQRGNKEFGYGADKYEPEDVYKGDVARALLYMYVTYGDNEEFDKSKTDVDLMKRWPANDPVSEDEVELNNWIKTESIQKNSNMFIERPSLVYFVKYR